MTHNEPGDRYWERLYTDFPDFQVALVDSDELLAESHAIPVPWDGTVGGLPSGWDEGFELGMTSDHARTALMAIAISVLPERQGQKLSSRMIQTFTDNARVAGLSSVIAPVRPTWKERYPLIPIERYVEWRREDGSHFDPWIRIHERVGGEILASAPESMTIRAPATEWEEWTGMSFPDDGEYVFPGWPGDANRPGRSRHAHRAQRLGTPRGWLAGREGEADAGAAALAVLGPNSPAVCLDEATCDREPETGAPGRA